MGYRSDVAYTIRFAHDDDKVAKQSFFTFLAEAKAQPLYATALEEVDTDEKKLAFYFYAADTKWYYSFPDVNSHVALVKLARSWCEDADGDGSCAYIFMRLGEDDDDCERECGGDYGYDWINLERRLATDWS